MLTATLSNINYWHGVPDNISVNEQSTDKTILFLKLFYSLNRFKVIISFLYNKYKNQADERDFQIFYLLFCLFSLSRLFFFR